MWLPLEIDKHTLDSKGMKRPEGFQLARDCVAMEPFSEKSEKKIIFDHYVFSECAFVHWLYV